MSEPVGNAPRSSDIPSNSHRERESLEAKKGEDTREPIQKIIEGKVVTRKPPWWKRAARGMIAEDAQNVGDYLLIDVVLPSLKNLVRDLVVGGTDRTLFGRGQVRRGGGMGMGSSREPLRTRYDQMGGEPRRMMSREARARHDFDEVTLDNRAEAIEVVETLIARVERYGAASVSDLYDLLGVTGSYADRGYGWTDLSTADVRQYRGAWLLDLPRPEALR